MRNRILLLLTTVAGLLLLVGCNTLQAPEESEYKKENDAYVEKVDKDRAYTKLLFLNASDPIYYKVEKEGNSQAYPYQESTVKMRLSGRLITGEVFQNEGELTSKVNGLIPGVQYAIQSMHVGDKWEVVIPQKLGYGSYARGYSIPAYSTLIFNIELLEILVQ